MVKKRIGLLGGTFNPVHLGHLAIAQWSHEKLGLDKVIFIPSFWPPHKSRCGVVDPEHRFQMVKLALKENPHFEVSDFEIRKQGKSYSIDTARFYKEKFPGADLYFIIGEDGLSSLSSWKNVNELAKIVNFVAVSRPKTPGKKSQIPVRFMPMPGLDISSSGIRKNIAAQKSVKYFLPEVVFKYIKKHGLYAKNDENF